MDEKMKKIYTVVIIVAVVFLIFFAIFLVTSSVTKSNIKNTDEKLYQKELNISATLPNILGSTNSYYDDYERKYNSSEDLKNAKTWMNLTFDNFEVYSVGGKNSVIKFTISNNNNMIVESNKFQLQLKDDDMKVVGVVDFEAVVLPSSGKINVTIDVNGDIANVKDIVVDDVNYTMQEVK